MLRRSIGFSSGQSERPSVLLIVYLTEHGKRLAAIVPAELAAELESLTPQQLRELLEDFADAQAARESLAEIEAGAEPVPAEQVWADLGFGT